LIAHFPGRITILTAIFGKVDFRRTFNHVTEGNQMTDNMEELIESMEFGLKGACVMIVVLVIGALSGLGIWIHAGCPW